MPEFNAAVAEIKNQEVACQKREKIKEKTDAES